MRKSCNERRWLKRQKILQQLFAMLGEDAFGVELHAFHRIAAVAQPHDHVLISRIPGVSGYLKLLREPIVGDDQ